MSDKLQTPTKYSRKFSRKMIESEEEVKKLNETETVPTEVKQWLLSTFSSPDHQAPQQGKNKLGLGTFGKKIALNVCGSCCFCFSAVICMPCCCNKKAEKVASRVTKWTSFEDQKKIKRLVQVSDGSLESGDSLRPKFDEKVAKKTQDYHSERHLALTYLPAQRSQRRNFRSIVQAIKAGIKIDAIFRKPQNECSIAQLLPKNVIKALKPIDKWEFDVFSIPSSGYTPLKWVLMDLLSRYNLLERFRISPQVLVAFAERLEAGYEIFQNPYHNSKHAADVTQTIHFLISHTGMLHWLTELEIFAMIIAAAGHDFEHTGTTNDFHINTKSDLALLYNDKSPLENHHTSALFSIMQDSKMNILSGLSRSEYIEFRSLVVDMILGTDMRMHFDQLQIMRNMIQASLVNTCAESQKKIEPVQNVTSGIDKRKSMCLILHCADISNPAKPYHIHCKWTEMLLEEFFRQGDDEIKIGLAASPMMDRSTTLIPESQIGFMHVIVQPAFTVLHDMFDLVTTQILLEFKKHGSRRASAVVLPCSVPSLPKSDVTINNENSGKTNKDDEDEKEGKTEDSETRDDLTKLQDRKTNASKPKLRSTPSWVESQKQKDSLGLNLTTPDDDEIMDRIQIVRVEEIMDRLKVFRENVTSIIDDNKSRWQEEKDRDEIRMNAANQ
jgi:calcium/calmodulin-dependent 3',5'-cyclic nucleotide phosphodiesterase